MITELEAGKKYKLIDKEGYISSHPKNAVYCHDYFEQGIVKIEHTNHTGIGYVGNHTVIGSSEYEYFELHEDEGTSAPETVNVPVEVLRDIQEQLKLVRSELVDLKSTVQKTLPAYMRKGYCGGPM